MLRIAVATDMSPCGSASWTFGRARAASDKSRAGGRVREGGGDEKKIDCLRHARSSKTGHDAVRHRHAGSALIRRVGRYNRGVIGIQESPPDGKALLIGVNSAVHYSILQVLSVVMDSMIHIIIQLFWCSFSS